MPTTTNPAQIQKTDSQAMAEIRPAYAVSVLVVSSIFLYFLGISTYPAVDPAEAYYVEAAREMIEIGNYITPHLNYQIYFSKPIMTFWLMAGSYKLFGVSEASARLPFAALVMVSVLATYYLTSKLRNVKAGLFAGLCLVTSPLLLLVARESPIDIAFASFLSIAVLATACSLSRKLGYAWCFIYIGLGLSVLTKGPAAILLYSMGALLFLALSRPSIKDLGNWLVKDLRILPGLGLFFLTALPWHLMVSHQTDGLFLKVFFLYENIARYAGHTNMGRMSFWFFAPVLLVGFFPWVLLLPACLKESFRGSASLPKSIFARLGALAEALRTRPESRALAFLLSFALVTFTFFSFSGTKLITYILPVLAPVAVLVGIYLEKLTDSSQPLDQKEIGSRRLLSVSILLYGLVVAVAILAGLLFLPQLGSLERAFAVLALVLFGGGAFRQYAYYRKGLFGQSLKTSFLTLVLSLSIVFTIGARVFYHNQQGDLMRISARAGSISKEVNMFGVFMPSSMFYARGGVNTFFLAKQIKPASPDRVDISRTIIVRDRDLEKLKDVPGLNLELVEKQGQWGLFKLPGYDVEKVMLLEDVFRVPVLFERLMKGDTSMGPLTVPYASGRAALETKEADSELR